MPKTRADPALYSWGSLFTEIYFREILKIKSYFAWHSESRAPAVVTAVVGSGGLLSLVDGPEHAEKMGYTCLPLLDFLLYNLRDASHSYLRE